MTAVSRCEPSRRRPASATYRSVRRQGGIVINWEAIGAVGEVLAAIGVVVTLIYLAGQLRQNTKELRSARHESYALLSFSVNDFRAEHADVLAKHFAGEELSESETIIANANAQKLFGIMEATFLHYREGTLSKDVFDARMKGLTAIMSYAPIREIWEDSKTYGFAEEFIQLVESHMPSSSLQQGDESGA